MDTKKKKSESEAQLGRFREMAREVEADESPHALDRAFARLDMKKKAPAKRKAKKRKS
jgi:hypothetical protein